MTLMRPFENRAGFALPMTILVIGFMTAGVLAAFARSSSEVQLVDDQRAQLTAFAMAEAGLQRYLATTKGPPAATVTYGDFAGGSATVTATLMRPAPTNADTAVWLISSVGMAGSAATGRLVAKRTVAQLAYRLIGQMQVIGSWTSLSGLDKAGSAGDISGSDACTGDVTAGVATPTGMLTGKDEAISGDPDHLEMGTQEEMAAQIKIDWVGITTATNPSIEPDIIVCVSGTYGYDATWSPCGSWPASFPTGYWPTIVINGSSSLPTSGRGTLIVTGDLTFGGNDKWEGIILVGGKITDNGSGDIAGAVVSGLNVLKGMPVGESSKANGTKDYTFDSCAVTNAASNQSKLLSVQNAWVDNWTHW
ncbi:MAG TPA: hypothetical protein VMN60_10525 [Longimicrobiales bacterium]|nr:hypothetical protein [Longimicrobiales bacterium]